MSVAASKIRLWRERPDIMVKDLFGVTPDPKQTQILKAFPSSPRIAMKASKGTGKTCTEAWLCWNFLLTRPHPKIAATSISSDNLSDNLWTEMAHWMNKSKLLSEMFTWTKTRIFAKQHSETWWMSARNWSKSGDKQQQANTLAGLHAEYIMFVLDESGGIPESVMSSAEAALSTCIEGHLVQGGNPTHLEGPLYRACTTERNLWNVFEMTGDPDDPNRSDRVSVDWARSQIEKYGKDNPWVLVNVYGKFPPSSFNALIGPDEVRAAVDRRYREPDFDAHPRILGIDVARFGDDCLRDDTEVLTDEGWKLFPELKGTEKVLSIEANGEKSSWQEIDEVVSYDFDGKLNELESRSLNFSVTDNHRFLVRTNPKSNEYKFEAYKNLPENFVIRERSGWSGLNPDTIKFTCSKKMPNGGVSSKDFEFNYTDWALFLGWFVAEGNVYQEKRKNGRKKVIISQNPGPKMESIKALLTKMGINWRLCSNNKQVEFSNNVIGKWLEDECGMGAANKKIPNSIKNSSEEVLKAFLLTFRLGDGTIHKNGSGASYYTSSPNLADDIQEILFKLGRAGSRKLKDKIGSQFLIGNRAVIRKHNTYVVYERSFESGKRVDKANVKQISYIGKIWCIRTKFQSFCIRRKGVPMWSGNSSIIFPRQGLQAFNPSQYRSLDGTTGAEITVRKWNEWQADGVFIDNTGGFGASWIDNLIRLGKSPIGIHFSQSSTDKQYFNKRTEMAFNLVEWIKRGGALPDIPELIQALSVTTYSFKGEQLIIEPKEDIKAKLNGNSPDHMDALMLTFALPVEKQRREIFSRGEHQVEYNPFSRDKVLSNDTGQYIYNPRG